MPTAFGPDRQLTYGEVCTMLLRMLGYKESDIGPFWPADYIAQAERTRSDAGRVHQGRQNTGHPCGRRDHAAQYARHLDALGRTGRARPSSAVFHPRRLKTAFSSKPAKPTARLRQMKALFMKTARSLRARPRANSTAA